MLATLGRAAVLGRGLALRDQVRRRARARASGAATTCACSAGAARTSPRAIPRSRPRCARCRSSRVRARRRDRRATTSAGGRASSGSRSACGSRARATSQRAMARVPVRAVFFDCLGSKATTCAGCRSLERKEMPRAACCRRRRRSQRATTCRARRGVLRGRLRDGARGHRGQARGEPLRGRALARLGQDQVPAPAGVRDRRLHRAAAGAAGTSARSTSGVYEDGQLVYVTKVGHAGSTTRCRTALWDAAPAARRDDVAVRARRAEAGAAITGSSRGSCARCASPSGPRRRAAPSDLPRAARRQAARGVPARGRRIELERRRSRTAAVGGARRRPRGARGPQRGAARGHGSPT